MPRKAFLADLKDLSNRKDFEGLTGFTHGEEDGHVVLDAQLAPEGRSYELTVIVSDVSEYPTGHYYFISASDDAPVQLTALLERMSGAESGSSLEDLFRELSRKLRPQATDDDVDMPDSQAEDFDCEDDDADDAESIDDFDDHVFGPDVAQPSFDGQSAHSGQAKLGLPAKARVRSDLLALKSAGFKVGVQGGLLNGLPCYLSVSCRFAKLGISEEAMQAWEVIRDEYLTLLIQYPNGYRDMAAITAHDAMQHQQKDVNFAIRVNQSYKPTLQECIEVFSTLSASGGRQDPAAALIPSIKSDSIRECFISKPLDQLLNARLLKLISYRTLGMQWGGAEQFYNDHQGSRSVVSNGISAQYLAIDTKNPLYPAIVNEDHLSKSSTKEGSLPLAAFQFLLRHFVRCSEFCLVCFNKVPDDLGALKPFVCENPLCLYQYMSLGFGPSIEHEVLTQPHVVDLLISFCHAAASRGDKLKAFPQGLSLKVPPSFVKPPGETLPQTPAYPIFPATEKEKPSATEGNTKPQEMRANFDRAELKLRFERHEACPVRTGDWIVVTKVGNVDSYMHCQVASTTYFPVVEISEPVALSTLPTTGEEGKAKIKTKEPTPPVCEEVSFYVYDQNFDLLADTDKRATIVRLLDLLPSVQELRDYVISTRRQIPTWKARISPAQAGFLRFIISSSRASIMQIDNLDADDVEGARKSDTRLYGLPGWMQFRFAMGTPDKERRFIDAVKETSGKNPYPTIFAWHGSALANWHSIIREGLHFNYIACGRAYGDGVYHSLNFNVSMAYSGMHAERNNNGWSQSRLQISNAVALSEIVNAPSQFRSSNPHLVVQHLDWIQTRFLFAQCVIPNAKLQDAATPPAKIHPQDPQYQPRGIGRYAPDGHSGSELLIPATLLDRSHGGGDTAQHETSTGQKRAINDIDDSASIDTSQGDLDIFMDWDTNAPTATPAPESKNGFVPGRLDVASLPLLPPPSYATPLATKRLVADFRAMVKTQEKQPAHELGWYLNADPDFMNNLFQWIVELHTFDPSLPLAKDMAERGIKSIVLELRFGSEFPISPPFVRVIRPRFLGFQQGGGGHVTLGGAICMELLTNNGWSAACTIESVLLQIKLAMESTDPRPARLATCQITDYGMQEAVEAFQRACRMHGWTIPSGLSETTATGSLPDQ